MSRRGIGSGEIRLRWIGRANVSWLVISSPDNSPYWMDVVPAVTLDGEEMMSAAHVQGSQCDCGIRVEMHAGGWPIYIHHDPEADEKVVAQ